MADSLPRQRGSVALVFDPRLWGGRDHPEGNERYWQPATILAVSDPGPDQTATVRFHHDGRESRGHFLWAMRDCETSRAAA